MDNEIARKKSSPGHDFLTYLCYQSDALAGVFDVGGSGGRFTLWIDGKIALEDQQASAPNTVTYSGDDFTSQDLKQALRAGKKVKEARFRLEKGEQAWSFTVRADRVAVSGLKIDMPRTADSDEQFYGRMLSIEALGEVIDTLFAWFLKETGAQAWKAAGSRQFQQWLQAP